MLQVYSCSEYNEVVNKRAAILILQVISVLFYFLIQGYHFEAWKDWQNFLIAQSKHVEFLFELSHSQVFWTFFIANVFLGYS